MALVLGGALGSMSCVTLAGIEANLCGNRVVEPDYGEACDSATEQAGTRCGAAWEYGACRYVCDYGASDGDICPTGYGCGLDGVCRKPGGLETTSITIAGGGTRQLMSGDFDGDERLDVVAINDSAIDIYFLTPDGYVDTTLTVPNDQGIPGIGDVDGDGLSDLALRIEKAETLPQQIELNASKSIAVWLGTEDRSLVPQTFPTVVSQANTRRLLPLGPTKDKDYEVLAFVDDGKSLSVETLELKPGGGHEFTPASMMLIEGSLLGSIGLAKFNTSNGPCAALAFEVTVPDPASNAKPRLYATGCNNGPPKPPQQFLTGNTWGGAWFADINNDTYPDLIYGQILAGAPTLRVRRFNPDPLVLDFEPANAPQDLLFGVDTQGCVSGSKLLTSKPLAIGDLNLDGSPDFVDSTGILFYDSTSGQGARVCNTSDIVWSQAVIGDFNGDGLNDLVAARINEAVLDVWFALAEGNINTFTVAVPGPVAELVGGDFDGDTLMDAAFRFGMPEDMNMDMGPEIPNPGELFAIFGEPLAVPSAPVSLGFVQDPINLTVARIRGENAIELPDTLSDLIILSRGEEVDESGIPVDIRPITLIQGNATRNLVSPLSIKSDTTIDQPYPSEDVFGVVISKLGINEPKVEGDPLANECDMPFPPSNGDDSLQGPSNIAALASTGKLWLAGCKRNGSSVTAFPPELNPIKMDDVSLLLAPVNKNGTEEALAFFMRPTNGVTTLGIIDYADGQFGAAPNWSASTSADVRLPGARDIDVPFVFADLDADGRRDVILSGFSTATKNLERKKGAIFVFWNREANQSKTLDANEFTEYEVDVEMALMGEPSAGMPPIVDIAALNLDGDIFNEIAILTQNGLYFAKLALEEVTDETADPVLQMPRRLEPYGDPPPEDDASEPQFRNAQALLAIDANSDGIEDLLVSDPVSLTLFLGKERF